MSGVVWNDFWPVNQWTPDEKSSKWDCPGSQFHEVSRQLIDESTGRWYSNEPKSMIRFKCALLVFGTPVVHLVASTAQIADRAFKLATLSHFRAPVKGETSYDFHARLHQAGKHSLQIGTALVALAGLELSAIYGVFRPYDGRKLYATIERAQYGSFILAPCFQPTPKGHFFGGSIDDPLAM